MAFININTNNLSRQLQNSKTYVDNWVYVPGTAITGEWRKPVAIESLDEFQSVFGTYSPNDSITYNYVAGLLSAGLPVLFRRIAYVNQDEVTEKDILDGNVVGVKKASTTLSHINEKEEVVSDIIITEKYGGTFGNDLYVTIKVVDGTAYYIEVYYNTTLLEKAKIATITSADTNQTEINQKIISGLESLELERVDIEVVAERKTKPETFSLEPITRARLQDGDDIDDALIANEIPASFDELTDKILYQPKFLTSGGYTDDPDVDSTPIADKMKEISKVRQDCRALIDLALGIPSEEQQTYASKVGYQQLSSTETIPSASMCAPWVYMQIGGTQEWMPPSYAYLTLVGSDLSKGGNAYTPKAGLTSGVVSNIIRPEFAIGSKLSEKWQEEGTVQINPIMQLQSGSYVIAGNSTLLQTDAENDETNAFTESSADLAVIEIRRFVYNLATELQYQYNGTTAFETFSLRTAKFFNSMISEGAMSDYNITNVSSDDSPRELKIQIDVYLTPTIKSITINLNVAYGSIEMSTGGAE
jgi:hypothetical protein